LAVFSPLGMTVLVDAEPDIAARNVVDGLYPRYDAPEGPDGCNAHQDDERDCSPTTPGPGQSRGKCDSDDQKQLKENQRYETPRIGLAIEVVRPSFIEQSGRDSA
jgi:hypothetical protein